MLTVREAAAQTRRSRQTIETWISTGLLDVTVIKTARGTVIRRYLNEQQLMSVLRTKLATRQRSH